MLTRPIPSTGEAVPVVGLGTWKTFDVELDAAARKRLEDVLGTFVALGGRLVDSSPMYGRAEQVVGDVADTVGLRPRLFVATKVWISGQKAGVRQMEASERKLRARPIDLMQVHNLLDLDAHMETLAAWKAEGRVRYVGITHYTTSGHDAVARAMAAHTPSTSCRSTTPSPSARPRTASSPWHSSAASASS
jgi:diketogulonate reductase-like aldo/keto reductase